MVFEFHLGLLHMLWRERKKEVVRKKSFGIQLGIEPGLYTTQVTLVVPRQFYSMLFRHQSSMWPGYEANINHTVYRIFIWDTVVKGVDVMQKERACTFMGIKSL